MAEVHEATVTALVAPKTFATSISAASDSGPVVVQPDRSTRDTASTAVGWHGGRVKGMASSRPTEVPKGRLTGQWAGIGLTWPRPA